MFDGEKERDSGKHRAPGRCCPPVATRQHLQDLPASPAHLQGTQSHPTVPPPHFHTDTSPSSPPDWRGRPCSWTTPICDSVLDTPRADSDAPMHWWPARVTGDGVRALHLPWVPCPPTARELTNQMKGRPAANAEQGCQDWLKEGKPQSCPGRRALPGGRPRCQAVRWD